VNDLRDDDVKSLLALALADGDAPLARGRVDPAADLARGRTLLRRRRAARFGGVAAAAAVCVGATSVALTVGGTPAKAPTVATDDQPSRTAQSRPKDLPSIALVAYTGDQVPGYKVAEVPKGWEIQGGNAYALTIAPKDAADKNPDSFLGKLVVMLQSLDAGGPGEGTPVSVDGRPGNVHVEGDTQVLVYQDAERGWVVIQAPTSLGWDDERIARFAAGVEVLGNAQGARG
jgi:hypothetical protein